jgi:peptidoglycan/xylan/chitin deacetylase (PgdA/CDA1 family)
VNGACVAPVPATLTENDSCAAPTPGAAAILDQLRSEGHLVANHTTTHRDLTTVPTGELEAELAVTDAVVAPRAPYNRLFFRAPYGAWNASVHATLAATPMNKYVGPIHWDIGGGPTDASAAATMAADWECWELGLTTRACGDRYLAEIRARQKGIVLLHERSGDTANHVLETGTGNTVDMVKYIVPVLEAEGFTFRQLHEVPAIAAVLPACHASCASCSGPAATECTSCPPATYLASGSCLPCATCAAGTYASSACAGPANTVCTACTPCPTGTFEAFGCTETTDRVCSACHESCSECTGPEASHCKCPAGSYGSGTGCFECRTCTAGSYFVAACTPTTNTVCALCERGTFSTDGATGCTPCPQGTYASVPGTTACGECGGCDDEDACTADSCSVTAGCVHTPVPGCKASRDGRPEGIIDDDSSYTGISPDAPGGSARPSCSAGSRGPRAPGSGAAPAALALSILALRRRRRSRA